MEVGNHRDGAAVPFVRAFGCRFESVVRDDDREAEGESDVGGASFESEELWRAG